MVLPGSSAQSTGGATAAVAPSTSDSSIISTGIIITFDLFNALLDQFSMNTQGRAALQPARLMEYGVHVKRRQRDLYQTSFTCPFR